MKRLVPLTLALAIVLAACGGAAAEDGPLIIYSGRSEELVQPLIDDFTEATGIEVEVRYASSTELAATLLQEGEAADADVFFAQDPASLGSVTDLLSPLPDDILDRVDRRFVDRDGRWIGTSGRVRTFIYNTSTTTPLPQTIDDVVDPAWEGKLGVAPTNGSFLAFVAAMILERGEEATLEWLKALAANQPQDYPKNSPIVAAADGGEIEGGLVNHYYLFRLRAEGAGQNAENWFIPAGDVGTLVMPAGAGILAGSDQSEAALRFVEYLLSNDAQTYFANETFEFPLVPGVDPAAGLPRLEEINAPDIDLSRLAEFLDDATRLVAEAGLV
ncbi:MAG TPA: iron ABC transporter substrate-binding protein [Acidimicrobiia bacterium]|nr:iron ABC transporter substrate-binding protein [Acidimicrobiia bacterium]